MATDGVDVGAWLALGFEEEGQERQPSLADPLVDEGIEGAVPLCYTCLDEDCETAADGEHNGIMYCSKHLPTYPQLSQDEIIERFKREVARFFNGCTVHHDPHQNINICTGF